MASIAYITDGHMLELHRLDRRRTINFWRPSASVNFRDFGKGDLLFFLVKDKAYTYRGEKGIIGYGRAASFHSGSVETMWKNYGVANGYETKDAFKKALCRVTRDHTLPEKISGIILEDVVFFQMPIYLSEAGMKIKSNTESYLYLEEDVPLKLLEFGRDRQDLWSETDGFQRHIDEEQLRYSLYSALSTVTEPEFPESTRRTLHRCCNNYLRNHPETSFVQKSTIELYTLEEDRLQILFPRSRKVDDRLWYGQALLLKKEIEKRFPYEAKITFSFLNEDGTLTECEL